MRQEADTGRRALQRIAVLLCALAALADRAAAGPVRKNLMVLTLLRQAEAVAWAFAFEMAGQAGLRRARSGRAPPVMPVDNQASSTDVLQQGAAIAFRLRLLALIVLDCADRLRDDAASPLSTTVALRASAGVLQLACLLPVAPDTS